jgi:hypothetical protein
MGNGRRFVWIGMTVAVLAGVASVAVPASAQEPDEKKAVPLTPLVQLQGYEFICKGVGFFGGFGQYCLGGSFQERNVTIFRSGRVVSVLTGAEQSSTPSGDSFTYTYTQQPAEVDEPKASARSINDLIAYLNSQSITNWRGPCDLVPTPDTDLTGLFTKSSYTILWYPADGSRHYTVISHIPHAKACPPQVHAIFDAIAAFGKTGTRSAVTDEP